MLVVVLQLRFFFRNPIQSKIQSHIPNYYNISTIIYVNSTICAIRVTQQNLNTYYCLNFDRPI